jgi:putative acetyltransferase
VTGAVPSVRPAWTIRLAAPADLTQIAAIFSRSIRMIPFLPKLHTDEEDLAFWRDVVMAEQTVHVAESDGVFGGVLADHEGFVTMLYVDPDRVRQGAGSALMTHAQARLNAIQLWCFQQNKPARALYERHGFIAAAFTDGSGNEEKTPDVRYVWRRT